MRERGRGGEGVGMGRRIGDRTKWRIRDGKGMVEGLRDRVGWKKEDHE